MIKKPILIILVLMMLSFGGLGYMVLNRQGKLPNEAKSNTAGNPSETTVSRGNLVEEIPLSVSQPFDNSTITNKALSVQGKTAPDAEVSINETNIRADKQGNFSAVIELDEGDNIITIVANDENGNVAERDLIVTYESGQFTE